MYFKAVIRSVLEYAWQVWHSELTIAQSDAIESQQHRALRIIMHECDYDLTIKHWTRETGIQMGKFVQEVFQKHGGP